MGVQPKGLREEDHRARFFARPHVNIRLLEHFAICRHDQLEGTSTWLYARGSIRRHKYPCTLLRVLLFFKASAGVGPSPVEKRFTALAVAKNCHVASCWLERLISSRVWAHSRAADAAPSFRRA